MVQIKKQSITYFHYFIYASFFFRNILTTAKNILIKKKKMFFSEIKIIKIQHKRQKKPQKFSFCLLSSKLCLFFGLFGPSSHQPIYNTVMKLYLLCRDQIFSRLPRLESEPGTARLAAVWPDFIWRIYCLWRLKTTEFYPKRTRK